MGQEFSKGARVIVKSKNINGMLKPVKTRACIVAACDHRPRRVLGMDNVAQHLGHVRPRLFFNFIADAPDDYTGVVAITAHHGL